MTSEYTDVRSVIDEFTRKGIQPFDEVNWMCREDWDAIVLPLAKLIAAEREACAKRAMELMERLNTDYRHEIAAAIRSGVNP